MWFGAAGRYKVQSMFRDAKFGGAVALALGLVFSTWIAVRAFERIKSDNTIQVTDRRKSVSVPT
jgi:hypothetical protein